MRLLPKELFRMNQKIKKDRKILKPSQKEKEWDCQSNNFVNFRKN